MRVVLLTGLLFFAVLSLQGCYKSNRYGVKASPPSHAPAYGRRAQNIVYYDYTYYPAYGIYYDPVRRVYFYPNGSTWVSSATLPRAYRKPGKGVKIKVDGTKPYLKVGEHRKKYPPGKVKDKKKKYAKEAQEHNGNGRGNGRAYGR